MASWEIFHMVNFCTPGFTYVVIEEWSPIQYKWSVQSGPCSATNHYTWSDKKINSHNRYSSAWQPLHNGVTERVKNSHGQYHSVPQPPPVWSTLATPSGEAWHLGQCHWIGRLCHPAVLLNKTNHMIWWEECSNVTLNALQVSVCLYVSLLFLSHTYPRRLTYMWWGCCNFCLWLNQLSLPTASCSVLESFVFFCLYGPFNCISFHKFSRQLSVFSLCSFSLISALLVLISLWKSPSALIFNPLWFDCT